MLPFPFTDQTTSKRRPAVVVSSEAYHNERPDLVILAITSQVRPAAGIGEVAVARWKEAGLLKPSALKPVVATIKRGWCCESWGGSKKKIGGRCEACST